MKTGNTGFVFRVMLVAAVWSAAAPAFAHAARQSGPQAVIGQATYDFGDVIVGEELMHVFNVSNAGLSPLQLSQTPLMSRASPAPADQRGGFQSLLRTASFASARLAAPA